MKISVLIGHQKMKRLGQLMYRSHLLTRMSKWVNHNWWWWCWWCWWWWRWWWRCYSSWLLLKLSSYDSCTFPFNTYLSVKTFGPNSSMYLQAAKCIFKWLIKSLQNLCYHLDNINSNTLPPYLLKKDHY